MHAIFIERRIRQVNQNNEMRESDPQLAEEERKEPEEGRGHSSCHLPRPKPSVTLSCNSHCVCMCMSCMCVQHLHLAVHPTLIIIRLVIDLKHTLSIDPECAIWQRVMKLRQSIKYPILHRKPLDYIQSLCLKVLLRELLLNFDSLLKNAEVAGYEVKIFPV